MRQLSRVREATIMATSRAEIENIGTPHSALRAHASAFDLQRADVGYAMLHSRHKVERRIGLRLLERAASAATADAVSALRSERSPEHMQTLRQVADGACSALAAQAHTILAALGERPAASTSHAGRLRHN